MAESQLPAPLIRSRLESGKVIPFLGSGASLVDRDPRVQPWSSDDMNSLPTANELMDYLAKPVKFPADEEIEELTKVAMYYEWIAGRADLDEELHKVFGRQARYGKVHEFLAKNPVPLLIISTNYDDLMERALDDQKKEYDLVIHLTPGTLKRATNNERADSLLWRPCNSAPRFVTDDDLAEIDLSKTFVIYKMHGSVDPDPLQSGRDSFVVTEDDYIDFLTRMTSQGANAIPSFVKKQIALRPMLFLGYSLRDWNLRVLLNQIYKASRNSLVSWAVQLNPSQMEERFWKDRSVAIFNMRVDEFVDELQGA